MFSANSQDIPDAKTADGGCGQVCGPHVPSRCSRPSARHAAPVEGPQGTGY